MVLVKINTYPFSFQKGNLLFHIILFICGKIDGTHFSCLFLKRLAPLPSTPKSKNRPHRELGGCGGGGEGGVWTGHAKFCVGLCVRHFVLLGRRRLSTENLIGSATGSPIYSSFPTSRHNLIDTVA